MDIHSDSRTQAWRLVLRRVVGLGLMLSIFPGLLACGKAKEQPIRVALFKSPAADAAQKLLPEFERATGLAVKADVLPYAELLDRVKTGFLAKSPRYDIVMADCIWIPEFAASGYLYSIDAFLADPGLTPSDFQFDDIISSVADYLGRYPAGGPLYGFPFMTNSHVLAYRKDLFDTYLRPKGMREPGKSLETAWTWDEYLQAAALLTVDSPSLPGGRMWGSSMQARAGAWIVYEWYTWLYGAGGRDIDYSIMEPVFTAPESIEAVRRYASLVGNYAPPAVLSWGHEEETQALASGQCAMDATWNVELVGYLLDPATSKHARDFDFGLSPIGAEGKPTPDMGGYGLLLSRFSRRPSDAYRLMVWLASPGVHRRIVLDGGSPFRHSEMTDEEVLKKYPIYAIYDQTLQHSIYRARVPQWPELQESISRNLTRALLQQATPDEAAQAMQVDAQRILAAR